MTTAMVEAKFSVALTWKDYPGGPDRVEQVGFADCVDAKDYAEEAYKSGRFARAEGVNCYGQTFYDACRKQVNFGD